MKFKKTILIAISIFFITLSIIMLFDRIIIPNIKNKNYTNENKKKQEEKIREVKENAISSFVKNETEKNKELEEEEIYIEDLSKQTIDDKTKKKIAENQKDDPLKIELPQNDSERIQYAIGQYISFINILDFKSAYILLDNSFKNFNFPTYESFEKYCNEKYKGHLIINYEYYQRMGDILVAEIEIKDSFGKYESFEQIFTITEKEEYDFRISFGLGNKEETDNQGGENV